MGRIRILHFSDLHEPGGKEPDVDEVFDAFVEDVKEMHETAAIDLVVFTGDLVRAGESVEAFRAAFKSRIVPVLAELSLPTERLAIAPGNHDTNRTRVDDDQELGLRANLTSHETLDQRVDAQNVEPFRHRMIEFEKFYGEQWPGDRSHEFGPNAWTRDLLINGVAVRVAVANSAWRATGRPADDDKGHLLIGRRQMQFLREDADGDVALFLCHHPPEWLAEFDRQNLLSELNLSFSLALFGHEHATASSGTTTPEGTHAESRAGSTYAGSRYRNGYTIVDMDTDLMSIVFTYRHYVPARREFDLDTLTARGGRLEIPLVSTRHQGKSSQQNMPAKDDRTLAGAISAARATLDGSLSLLQRSATSKVQPSHLLIPPPCYWIREGAGTILAGEDNRERVPIEELIFDDSVVVINGASESGKTSALHWCLAEVATRELRLPIFLDFGKLANSKSAVTRGVRQQFLNAGIRTAEDLSDAPQAVLAIDNVRPEDPRGIDLILEFIRNQPTFKIILSVPDDGFTPNATTWLSCEREIRSCHLGQYRAREIRSLAQQIYPEQPDEWDKIVEASVAVLVNQGIRRTPWSVVMILMIFQYEPAPALTDMTMLVEKYTDVVLGKWHTQLDGHADGVQLDFVNRQWFLLELAAELTRRHHRDLPEVELRLFATEYLERFGLDVEVADFLTDFYDRHVLVEKAGQVSFSPADLQHFFAAKAVQKSLLDLDTLLADTDLHFDSVVHLCGLDRNREDVLTRVHAALVGSGGTFSSTEFPIFSSLDSGSLGAFPQHERTLEILSRIGHEAHVAQSESGLEQAADEWLDQRDELDAEPVVAPHDSLAGLSVFVRHVVLLSLALQRSEHVGNPSLKAEMYRDAIYGWAKVLGAAAAIESEATDEERERRRGSLRETGMRPSQIDELEHVGLFLDAASCAIGTLGERKLGAALRDAGADPLVTDELVPAMLHALIMSMEDVPGWKPATLEVARRYGNRPHVKKLLWWFLASSYFSRTASVRRQSDIEEVLGEISAASNRGREKAARADVIRQLREARARGGRGQGPMDLTG